MDRRNKLILNQAERKLKPFIDLRNQMIPDTGWIAVIRQALGISMKQLADRIGKTPQAVNGIQRRERDGNISMNSLREIASALDMKVVYAIIPNSADSLEEYIRQLAEKKAEEIVARTHNTMLLENQEVSEKRRKEAILEIAEEFISDPKKLW